MEKNFFELLEERRSLVKDYNELGKKIVKKTAVEELVFTTINVSHIK